MAALDSLGTNNSAVDIIGWGVFDNANFDPDNAGLGDQPSYLQQTTLDYLPLTRYTGEALPAMVVVAWEPNPSPSTQPNGADTCFGDSGGPLFVTDGSTLGGSAIMQDRLVGITSFGSAICNSQSAPGIYTRVADFTSWIESTTANNSDALTDLRVTVTHPTQDILPGSTSDDFTLTIYNDSETNNVANFDVSVSGTNAGNVSLQTGTDNTLTCSGSGSLTLNCSSKGTLNAGQVVLYHFSVTDLSNTMRTTSFSADITAQSSDDYRIANNTDQLAIHYVPGADMSVVLDGFNTASGTFNLTITNNSDLLSANDVSVTLSSNQALHWTDTATCIASDKNTVTCELGTMIPLEEHSQLIRLPRTTSPITYALDATVSHSGEDPDVSNNTDSRTSFIVSPVTASFSGSGSSGGAIGLLLISAIGLRRRRR